jgi:hypothetical protein
MLSFDIYASYNRICHNKQLLNRGQYDPTGPVRLQLICYGIFVSCSRHVSR